MDGIDMNTKLIIVGGFLGAGKTTSIISLAKMLRADGKRIIIVTNDQGSQLVDTEYLKSQGLDVHEITGGCFCCNFDEFVARLSQISKEQYPDYVLAEPVGSCTDLVATIMKPIRAGHAGEFSLMPLSVVVDPKRLVRVKNEKESPFPNEINYLFKKQIEEADIIALNKADMIEPKELEQLLFYLKKEYPEKDILPIVATEDKGMASWVSHIVEMSRDFSVQSLEVDYDTYAKAEADLGWLNTSTGLLSNSPIDANAFLQALTEQISQSVLDNGLELAHLKMYMVSRHDFCKLSRTSVYDPIKFDKEMKSKTKEATLIINIRAFCEPKPLRDITEEHLDQLTKKLGITMQNTETQAFAPSYPTPRHRII